MPRDRERTRTSDPARQAARRPQRRGNSPAELHRSAARARRAEIALVSSYLRALRRLGELPIRPPRPEVPH